MTALEQLTVEPWTYEVDGVEHEGRKVWHVPTPGPIGCGVVYLEILTADLPSPDGKKWDRHVYAWRPVDAAD